MSKTGKRKNLTVDKDATRKRKRVDENARGLMRAQESARYKS